VALQELGNFGREVYDAAGRFQSRTPVPMQVLGGGVPVDPQFLTPLALNRVTATRLIIGAENGVYESDDQGDTLRAIGPGIQANGDAGAPIAYGAQGNADVLYVGAGNRVFVRTAAHPAPLVASAAYPGTAAVVGIAIPPAEPQTAHGDPHLGRPAAAPCLTHRRFVGAGPRSHVPRPTGPDRASRGRRVP
jgi:hypothetical protein